MPKPRPPRESTIQAAIIRELRLQGAYVIKAHQAGMGAAGTPDLLACIDGRFVAIEVKRPGQHLTNLQAARLDEIRHAGGVAIVAGSVDELLSFLRFFAKVVARLS